MDTGTASCQLYATLSHPECSLTASVVEAGQSLASALPALLSADGDVDDDIGCLAFEAVPTLGDGLGTRDIKVEDLNIGEGEARCGGDEEEEDGDCHVEVKHGEDQASHSHDADVYS